MKFIKKHNKLVRFKYGLRRVGAFIDYGYNIIVEPAVVGGIIGYLTRPLYKKGGIWKVVSIVLSGGGGFVTGACLGEWKYYRFLKKQEQLKIDEDSELWDEE